MTATSTTELAEHAAVPSTPAIEVTDLSINYRIRVANQSLAADLRDMVRFRTSRDRIVPAVKNVTFEVPRGSVLGIIGRNGAGKSTLLRALSGALAPDTGRIVVRGRMSLIAVGLGFNNGLTGRENIRLGGLAAGLSEHRLAELTGSIAEFAQLDEYLDYPIRTYSTGMRARLGFAVASHLDPEVLLIDEALSGGDAAFAEKVRLKMVELCGEGRTIVLVTHGLSSVRSMATNALWLHQGQVAGQGTPAAVVAQYLRYCRLKDLDLDSDGVG